jgi:DNA sulfur modification protein DndD
MKITKATLENWGPYRGIHEIDIDVQEGSPLVIVWGKNGGGKTKFIDAMKWVFAGGDLGDIRVGPYINLAAISAGQEFETSVTIDFTQNDSKFRVKRKIKVDPAFLPDPESGNLLQKLESMPDRTFVTLEKIGEAAYTSEQAKSVLRRLFPARLVNFYFFDAAELVSSFRAMEGSAGSYASSLDLQNSVETAMGFKGFESYIETLKSMERDLSVKADKDTADRRKLDSLKAEKSSAESSLKVLDEDMQAFALRIRESRDRLLELRMVLEGMGDFLEQQREKSNLQGQIQQFAREIDVARVAIKEQFGNLWAAPLAGMLTEKNLAMQAAKKSWEHWRQQVRVQEAKVASSAAEIERPNCPNCDRPMDSTHRAIAQNNLESEKARLSELEKGPPREAANYNEELASVYASNVWSPVKEIQLAQMVQNMKKIGSHQVAVLTMRNRIGQIDTQMGAVDQIDFLAVHQEILELESRDTELVSQIASLDSKMRAQKEKVSGINRRISSLAVLGGSPARTRLLKIQKLIAQLSFILLELKSKVRQEIEDEGNKILSSLSSPIDKEFKLYLSQEYNLGTDKFNPNNGFKQQLILAFLFAIPRVAKAPFPVVIDSPLQHMDINNRENFLSWCTTGLTQLVLLPHDAEIKIDEVEQLFGEKLSRFYRLNHDSKTKASSITRLG